MATEGDSVFSDTAQYDQVRRVLLIGEARLNELAELIEQETDPAGWDERWSEDGLVVAGRLDPVVEGIGRVVRHPARVVTVERVASGMMAPLLVVWDTAGRVIFNEAMADGRMSFRLSSFDLLPSILMHELALLRALDVERSERQPFVTTTEAIEALLTGAPATTVAGVVEAESVLAGVHSAWRVLGAWSGGDHDAGLIGLMADSGFWLVVPEGEGQARVVPGTVADLAAKLGDVVTGRDEIGDARVG